MSEGARKRLKGEIEGRMEQASRECSWTVSNGYFRLITECIRLYSNAILECATLADILDAKAANANEFHKEYEAESLRKHLAIIPTEGLIPIEVTILESSYDLIEGARPTLEEVVGDPVSFATAVSLILFDVLVEENTTELVTKLGLGMMEADAYKAAARKKNPKVVPIRPS